MRDLNAAGMGTPASTSLSFGELLETRVERLHLSQPAAAMSGLTPAAGALVVAAIGRSEPCLVVVPADKDIDPFVSDARFFLGALTGREPAAVDAAVLPFPSPEVDPYRGLAPHFDVASTRARTLVACAAGHARMVVASAAALLPRLVPPDRMLRASIDLAPGHEIELDRLVDLLTDAGFTRVEPVDQHGEFSVRGGVVDVFPAGMDLPLRLEFVGDVIESLREFDPMTQRSVRALDAATIAPVKEQFDDEPRGSANVFAFLPDGARLVVVESNDVERLGRARTEALEASHADAQARGESAPPPVDIATPWNEVARRLDGALRLDALDVEEPEPDPTTEDAEPSPASPQPDGGRRHIRCQPTPSFHGRVAHWVDDLNRARDLGETAIFVAETAGRAERVVELLRDHAIAVQPLADELAGLRALPTASAGVGSLYVTVGTLTRGFRLLDAAVRLYAETDIFDEERIGRERRRAPARQVAKLRQAVVSDFRDLKVGDFVVHVDNGIGRFVGLKQIAVGEETQEFMELRYADSDKLFVPVDRLDLVQKYTGGGRPSLDKLGGVSWERAKTRVRKAMRDMAEELLKLYAARQAVNGYAFGDDTHWQEEFEGAFAYELTPDQLTAIADIKRDMESPTPMDRLLCGDVGYGKTEVAMRAAFKAVMDGKQVAFLAPTTVLALQHFRTLSSRFAAFPVRIDMASRFRSRGEQRDTIAALADGRVDIIVGTHRLLSKDVRFRDLGLLIVDEEQRFGVAHKERLKQLRRSVDVLTMTATPIPRTLNMSLVGIRDMSIIETPPKDRQAIQTHVLPFETRVIASAVKREIERGGQVYVVHNRVESIHSFANLVSRLLPEARVGVGHGQMAEDELERVMVRFVERHFDVLVATTIVENGLDIPNANTIVVNRADRYGLAQLYQLRGRVGRSDRRAYAYLLVPPVDNLSDVARKRLAAIREFSDLGSGFRVAALDLEIRGAGNLLGGEQSGHIDAIGFELYTKLLEEAVRELKGEELEDDRRAAVNLKIDIRIGEDYIADMTQRLSVYRRIASAREPRQLEQELDELRDRYGTPPPAVHHLAAYARVRMAADRLGVESIDREAAAIVLRFRLDAPVEPGRLVGVLARRPDLRLVPPGILRMDLAPPIVARKAAPGPTPLRPPGSGPSWWTARARAGAVTPGFTKADVLRKPPEDPLAEGGVVNRVETLLEELESVTSRSGG